MSGCPCFAVVVVVDRAAGVGGEMFYVVGCQNVVVVPHVYVSVA